MESLQKSWTIRLLTSVTIIGALFIGAASLPAAAGGLTIKKLAHNIKPSPDFTYVTETTPCIHISFSTSSDFIVTPSNPACVSEMTKVIDGARAVEGVKKLVLPSNWLRLSAVKQLFVITNIERIDRGFTPYIGMNASLNSVAQAAAKVKADPYPPSSFAVGSSAPGIEGFASVWAASPNVLSADYEWLYNDGWGGTRAATSNYACLTATDSRCWGHRDALLGWDPALRVGVGLRCTTCEMGAGVAPGPKGYEGIDTSMAVLVVRPSGQLPPMTFTWTQELPYFHTPIHK